MMTDHYTPASVGHVLRERAEAQATTEMVERCRAGDQPIRIDDEHYEASQAYYDLKADRNSHEMGAAIAVFKWPMFCAGVYLGGYGLYRWLA